MQLLRISGVVVSQGVSRPAAVISSTVFDLGIVFSAITTTKGRTLARKQLGRFGSIAVVYYDFAFCNTWPLFSSQGKAATLIR